MSVFAILPLPPFESQPIEAAIALKYPLGEYLKISDHHWLVSDTGIAKDVSDKLGISNAEPVTMSAVVFAVGGYYGRAPNHVWEWIALKLAATKAVIDAPA